MSPGLSPLTDPLLLGIASGLLTAVPGGPVNVTILNEGARRGFLHALFISAGALLMESVYCTAAFAGFGGLFRVRTIQAAMELGSFLLTLWLGIKYLRGDPIPGETLGLEIIEHRFHPHTAFWIGFSRVLANPGILLLWITITATFLAHGWLGNSWHSKGLFVGGVALGGGLWFTLLSWGVSRGHGRFSPRTLQWFSRLGGVFLLGAAAILGGKIVSLLRDRS